MAKQKQDDQLEHTYSSYVRIRDVSLNSCQKRWMIGRSGERGSGISVLAARHDDDDDDDVFFRMTILSFHPVQLRDVKSGPTQFQFNSSCNFLLLSLKILFTNPSARAGYDTRSIFKRSLTGLNSEFSFS